MGKTSVRARFVVPLLALVLAFAFAPAAFAAPADDALELRGLAVQDGAEPATTDSEYGIGADLDRAIFTLSQTKYTYSGSECMPTVTGTLDGRPLHIETDFSKDADCWMFYMNNVNTSKGVTDIDLMPQVVIATFSEDLPYVYTKQLTFTINQASIKNAKISVPKQTYTGKQLKPTPVVKFNGLTLKKGADYTVAYGKNIKVGNGTVKVTGKGNFKGKATAKFTIKKASINDAVFSPVKDKTYTGNAITPSVKVKYKGKYLKVNKDYTITYKHNKNVGVASIVIKGKGNLKGRHEIDFAINAASISKCSVSLSSATWTGGWVYPSVTVKYNNKTLKRDKDYTLRFADNSEVGTGKVYIQGKGNFNGTIERDFTIVKRPLTDSGITVAMPYWETTQLGAQPKPQLTYNGRTLIEAYQDTWGYWHGDYVLAWKNNNKVGTAQVIVRSVNNNVGFTSPHFSGERVIEFTIKKANQ